jgi:hypothetical protein
MSSIELSEQDEFNTRTTARYLMATITLPIEIVDTDQKYQLHKDRMKIQFTPCPQLPEISPLAHRDILNKMFSTALQTPKSSQESTPQQVQQQQVIEQEKLDQERLLRVEQEKLDQERLRIEQEKLEQETKTMETEDVRIPEKTPLIITKQGKTRERVSFKHYPAPRHKKNRHTVRNYN